MAGRAGRDFPSALILAVCLALVYAVAVYCRLGVVGGQGDATSFDITTADGYGWLAAISGMGALADHLLARVGRLVLALGVVDRESFALYAPVFTGALAAPLMTYWAYVKSDLAGGFFAGILGAQLPAIYSRTGFGYFDSDAVVLPLLLLAVICYEAWFDYLENRAIAGKRFDARLLAGTIALGAGMHLGTHVHVFFAFNAVAMAAVSAWLYPKQRIPCLYVLLTAVLGPVGILPVLFLYWLDVGAGNTPRRLRSFLTQHRAMITVIAVSVVVCVAVFAELSGMTDFASRIGFYLYGPLAALWSGEASSMQVQELAGVGVQEILQLLTGNVYLSLLGLIAVAAAIRKERRLLFFLFPLLLGLLAPVIGKRFLMFGSLVVGLAGGLVLARLASGLTENRAARFGMLGLLGAFYCQQLYGVYQSNPPAAFDREGVKRLMSRVGAVATSECCGLVLASWGRGYMASFYARLPAVMDGASHPPDALRAYGRMMLSTDNGTARAEACRLVGYQSSRIESEKRHFDCASACGAPVTLYVLVTWDDIVDQGRFAGYAGKDPSTAGGAYAVLDAEPVVDVNRGLVETAGETRNLASLDIISSKGVVDNKEFNRQQGWHLIVNRPLQAAVLMDESRYDAFMVRTFLGRDRRYLKEWAGNNAGALATVDFRNACGRKN